MQPNRKCTIVCNQVDFHLATWSAIAVIACARFRADAGHAGLRDGLQCFASLKSMHLGMITKMLPKLYNKIQIKKKKHDGFHANEAGIETNKGIHATHDKYMQKKTQGTVADCVRLK